MEMLQTEVTNDMLVRLTHQSLEDLTKLTPLVPVDDNVYPPAETKKDREKVQTLSPEEFEKHKFELVNEFVQRAKQVELLIELMPSTEDASSINIRIEETQKEIREADAEYVEALARAQALHEDYKRSLAVLLEASNTRRMEESRLPPS
ncbi:hypothetical protein QFC21_003485 [Naganishia friedmannii]|uniref:Uncharacterized protein n=1 Tax=Naganishia friedmannii TaxID=89922 RepID=A0ACC2VR84_9TREE|nr:hypothetical protein QFC21_003485 [Naganishia friedmannii]